jgi:hypothetical protein
MAGNVKGDIKGRMINSHLMAEATNRLMDKHGIPLKPEDIIRNTEKFGDLVERGVKSTEAARSVLKDQVNIAIKKGLLSKDKALDIAAGLDADLESLGRRIYFTAKPHTAARYSSGLTEAGMAAKKIIESAKDNMGSSSSVSKAKSAIKGMADISLGGVPTMVADALEASKYKPHQTINATTKQVHGILDNIRSGRSHPVKGISGDIKRVVFGASVPTGKLGYLEDFPVLKHVIGASPGIGQTVKSLGLENYNPGNDYSVPHLVPRKNIQHVDLIDEVGKIHRVNITDAQKAARSPLLSRLRRTALPAALTAAGAYQVYRALRPKKFMVRKDHPMADLDKKSSVRSDLLKQYKVIVPPMIAAGALGYASHALASKVVKPRVPKDKVDQIKEMMKSQVRMNGASMATVLGAGAAGSVLGRLFLPMKDVRFRRALGAMAGTAAAAVAGAGAIEGRENARHPETGIVSQHLSEKHRDWLRNHPSVGAAKGALVGGALPLAALYTARKYYPSKWADLAKAIKKI